MFSLLSARSYYKHLLIMSDFFVNKIFNNCIIHHHFMYHDLYNNPLLLNIWIVSSVCYYDKF